MADKDTSIRIMCPNLVCRKVLAVPSTARGKTVRCRACGTAIRIPGGQGNSGGNAPPRKSA
ncbi:MAG: hypothetical protein KIT54_03660 [Phycisphaeraceae bacterium]|nr:hypothetical protein [Phycisphaeraceae bacterium]